LKFRAVIFGHSNLVSEWINASDTVMDKKSSTQFKGHIELAIRELSSAIVLAREVATPEEFIAIRKPIGDIIADADTLLHDSIYPDHPSSMSYARNNLRPA
jgi:hypothetical protein